MALSRVILDRAIANVSAMPGKYGVPMPGQYGGGLNQGQNPLDHMPVAAPPAPPVQAAPPPAPVASSARAPVPQDDDALAPDGGDTSEVPRWTPPPSPAPPPIGYYSGSVPDRLGHPLEIELAQQAIYQERNESIARTAEEEIKLNEAKASLIEQQRVQMEQLAAKQQSDDLAYREQISTRIAEADALADKLDKQVYTPDIGANLVGAIGVAIATLGGDGRAAVEITNRRADQHFRAWQAQADNRRQAIGAKQNVVQMYRQMLGDKQAGDLAARAALDRNMAMQVQAIGARSENNQIRERADQLSYQLSQQALDRKAQVFERMHVSGFMTPKMAAAISNPKPLGIEAASPPNAATPQAATTGPLKGGSAKETAKAVTQAKQVFPNWNGTVTSNGLAVYTPTKEQNENNEKQRALFIPGIGLARNAEDYKVVTAKKAKLDEINSLFVNLVSLRKQIDAKYGGLNAAKVRAAPEYDAFEMLKGNLQAAVSSSRDQGVIQKHEESNYNAALAGAGNFQNSDYPKSLGLIRKANAQVFESLVSAHGIIPAHEEAFWHGGRNQEDRVIVFGKRSYTPRAVRQTVKGEDVY